jgi:hypothetical protein
VVALTWLRLFSVPPTALVSAKVNPTGGALKVNVTAPVPWARFKFVLSIDIATVRSASQHSSSQRLAIRSRRTMRADLTRAVASFA